MEFETKGAASPQYVRRSTLICPSKDQPEPCIVQIHVPSWADVVGVDLTIRKFISLGRIAGSRRGGWQKQTDERFPARRRKGAPMSRRVSLRAKVSGISIRAAIRLSDGARRAAPVMLLIGVLFAGAAVWLTASAKASHWVWKGWERMFGPQSLTGATPRVFAQLGGSGNYTISSIDEPSAGTSPMEGTLVSAVNASGAMTGAYSDQTGVAHGFVYANGTFTSFDAPNAGSTPQAGWFQGTMGVGIDTAGDVVGVYADSNNAYHGFLLPANSTTPIEFDDPDAPTTTSERGTFPMGINDNGQIVGFYTTCCYNTTSAYYGFLLAAGNFAPGNFTASANYTTIMAPGAGTGRRPTVSRKAQLHWPSMPRA